MTPVRSNPSRSARDAVRRLVAVVVAVAALASASVVVGAPVPAGADPAPVGGDPFAVETINLDAPVVAPRWLSGSLAPASAEPCWCVGSSRTVELDTDAEFVVLGWSGDPAARFAVRTRGPSGWSQPVVLRLDAADGPDPGTEGPAAARLTAGPVWAGWGTTAVSVTVLAGSPTSVSVEAWRSRLDRPDDPATQTAMVAPASAAGAGTVPRSGWGAAAWAWSNDGCGGGPQASGGIDMVVVHHTATSNAYAPGDTPSILRAIQRYHQQNNGWCDIGYNFLVDRYGVIYEGRSGSMNSAVRGSHASNFNTRTMGVSMLGQFHPGASPTASTVPAAQLDGTIRLIRALAVQWRFNPAARTTYNGVSYPMVVGHRDVNATTCPGDNAYPLLARMRIDVPVAPAEPFGALDRVVVPAPGQVRVAGWTVDPDTTDPLSIHVYANGTFIGAAQAAVRRADVGAAYPSYGPDHGFNATMASPGGLVQVCVYAINVGSGSFNPLLGCRMVEVVAANPFGNLDRLDVSSRQVRVAGWAIDPDTVGPVDIVVRVDDVAVATFAAATRRADVGAAHRAFGPDHGFNTLVGVEPGERQVCVDAVNTGPGVTTRLGCRTVTIGTGDPFGVLDRVTVVEPGQVRVSGWAIDPDTVAPIVVDVWVLTDAGGQFAGTVTASTRRADVGAAFPAFGPEHGFNAVVGIPAEATTVCVYAINTGPGVVNPLLGCQPVVGRRRRLRLAKRLAW
jgi:hypothetical protein